MYPIEFSLCRESQFIRRILDIRAMELAIVKKMSLARAWMVFLMQLTPTVTAMATFLAYSASSYEFDAGSIFSALSYFNLLRLPLMMLPFLIVIMAQNVVSMRRLQAFLESPEVDRVDESVYNHVSSPSEPYDVAVRFTDVTCRWKFVEDDVKKVMAVGDRSKKGGKRGKGAKAGDAAAAEATPTGEQGVEMKAAGGAAAAAEPEPPAPVPFSIRDISMELPRGSLVMIIGAVGSGKSSLVSALMNEMVPEKGLVEVNGRIAYVPQSAWIINASLKNNILFERPYDEARYQKVLEAANLRSDLALLADGDNTEIGEVYAIVVVVILFSFDFFVAHIYVRFLFFFVLFLQRGINLSGGQRQRVSIARAMYGIMAAEEGSGSVTKAESAKAKGGKGKKRSRKSDPEAPTASGVKPGAMTSQDILVLDDPLSAVDAHVAKAIFENCVIGIGRNATRVMVCSLLPRARGLIIVRFLLLKITSFNSFCLLCMNRNEMGCVRLRITCRSYRLPTRLSFCVKVLLSSKARTKS